MFVARHTQTPHTRQREGGAPVHEGEGLVGFPGEGQLVGGRMAAAAARFARPAACAFRLCLARFLPRQRAAPDKKTDRPGAARLSNAQHRQSTKKDEKAALESYKTYARKSGRSPGERASVEERGCRVSSEGGGVICAHVARGNARTCSRKCPFQAMVPSCDSTSVASRPTWRAMAAEPERRRSKSAELREGFLQSRALLLPFALARREGAPTVRRAAPASLQPS